VATACLQAEDKPSAKESIATREAPTAEAREPPTGCPRGMISGRDGATERLVVPLKPGNAGGGKEPQLKVSAGSDEEQGD